MRSLIALSLLGAASAATDYTQYVNPLIGSGSGGHVFAGATTPFGLVKVSPDSNSPDDNQGGFNSGDYPIIGFSQTHDSGTGGGKSLGNFPIFPLTCPDDQLENCGFTRNDRQYTWSDVVAQPGYFKISLNNNVDAEMTSTARTALHKYTFKSNPTAPVLGLELMDLQQSRSAGGLDFDASTNRVTGQGTFNPSFGVGTYDLYFCADFKGAKVTDHAIFYNTRIGPGDAFNITDDSIYGPPPDGGILLQFGGSNTVEARVGISYISRDQACQNAESEAGDWNFNNTRQQAVDEWNEYLSRVDIADSNASASDLELFYSSFYRAFINPQNLTGENPLWESDAPHWTSFYCLWDAFRTTMPFAGVFAPQAETEMVNALVDIQKHEGWLPDCRMTTNKGYTQGGSNADNVLADLFLKGIHREQINTDDLFGALVKDAEVEPPNWDLEGRGGLASWKSVNYIPAQDFDIEGSGLQTRSASRTLEYAYNDFCISQVAKALNKSSECKTYLERSGYWTNLWNNQTTSVGFTGFIQPKYMNGTWGYVDPRYCSPALDFGQCFLNPHGGEYYEASAWTYTLLVAHDYANLVNMLGGANAVAPRLDAFFHQNIQDVGDEIGWLPIYMGHYVGNTSIAADRIRELIPASFNTSETGLPGNDDSGAMATFVAFSMLGLYPNAGQDVYLISSPFFSDVSLRNEESGKVARVQALGLSDTNRYIQSAKLNGQDYEKNWVTHEFFTNGDQLELTMGSKPSTWGSKGLPPSVSDGGYSC